MVDKRERLETLRKFANIPDFRALAFFNSLSDLGASEDKLLYNGVNAVSLASDVNVKFRKVIIERFKIANSIFYLLQIWSHVVLILIT